MTTDKRRPTVEEIYALLRESDLPTVLVEGKDDIIFYRAIEEELRDMNIDVDMLPAGNKGSVLELRRKIKANPILTPVFFVVDKDLWVYPGQDSPEDLSDVITTSGYSIENDLYLDGELESLLTPKEFAAFKKELETFAKWYALAVKRNFDGSASGYRTAPGKVLDDENFYNAEINLREGETFPDEFFQMIVSNYSYYLRGKSLFALLLRQLSGKGRDVKFSGKQLMWIGARRKGINFKKIELAVRNALIQPQPHPQP